MTVLRVTEDGREELAEKLAIEIWDCWHGPLARIPSTHRECVQQLLAMFERIGWTARAARERELLSEVMALRDYKKRVDIAWTAGMLGLSGEVGFKIQMHEFVTSLKVAFRQAEDEYMKTFGAEAALSDCQPQEK